MRDKIREVVEYLLKIGKETDKDVIYFYTDCFMTIVEEEQETKQIDLQKEYITLLEKALSDVQTIAHIHHYRAKQEDINEGERLRKEIKDCQ